jgi:uncharacterized protein
MLLQFSIKNYKTFKEPATLSLLASNYDKSLEEENVEKGNIFGLRILRGAVVYGANASGKSKLIEALATMRRLVMESSKESQKDSPIGVEPFLFETTSAEQPSEFEVIFLHKNEIFRYGFEVTKSKIISEWLFHRPKTKEVELFYRDGNQFDINTRRFPKGDLIAKADLVRDNALMLSVAAQFNDVVAGNAWDWFLQLTVISGLHVERYQSFTMGKTTEALEKQRILEILRAADLGIHDLKLLEFDMGQLPADTPQELKQILEKRLHEGGGFYSDVLVAHGVYDPQGNLVGEASLSLGDEESAGTQKFYALTGPIIDALRDGHVLVVDELDSRLHPNLVGRIVGAFNSSETNPHGAQLIFNTHDTNLLSSNLFRRDQIWFTEKDQRGAAKLYSLADFKEVGAPVRNNANYEINYIRGKYGAVPYLGDLDIVFKTTFGKVEADAAKATPASAG